MICLKTGDAGKDATGREDDPDLLGPSPSPTRSSNPIWPSSSMIPRVPAAISLAQPTQIPSMPAWPQSGIPTFKHAWPTLDPIAPVGAAAIGRGIGSIIPIFLSRKRSPSIPRKAISTCCRRRAEKPSAGERWSFSISALPPAAQPGFALKSCGGILTR